MLCDSSARPHCPHTVHSFREMPFLFLPLSLCTCHFLLILLLHWKRTRCRFLFFSLKIPLDYHTPPPVTPEEMGEPRDTIEANISENHSPVPVVGAALHPWTLPWASMSIADSPTEAGSPALCWASRGDISGTVILKVPKSCHLLDQHEGSEVTSWWEDVEGHEHLTLKL